MVNRVYYNRKYTLSVVMQQINRNHRKAHNSKAERNLRRYNALDPNNRYSSYYLWEPK